VSSSSASPRTQFPGVTRTDLDSLMMGLRCWNPQSTDKDANPRCAPWAQRLVNAIGEQRHAGPLTAGQSPKMPYRCINIPCSGSWTTIFVPEYTCEVFWRRFGTNSPLTSKTSHWIGRQTMRAMKTLRLAVRWEFFTSGAAPGTRKESSTIRQTPLCPLADWPRREFRRRRRNTGYGESAGPDGYEPAGGGGRLQKAIAAKASGTDRPCDVSGSP